MNMLAKNEPEETATADLQAAIDKIDFDGGIALEGQAPTPTPEPEPEPKEAEGEPTPEPTTEPVVEPVEADPEPTPGAEPEGGEADKPALPDSHYRAALRMGMQPDEISELYDTSPELAAKTIAKCYEMVNASSKQLGEIGRAAQKAQNTPEPQSQPVQPQANTRVSKLIDKVKDHYGDDDPMAEVLTELLKDRQPVPQPQRQEPQPTPAQERSVDEEIAARQQINTFFGADDMGAYDELYGENASATGDWSHLTGAQRANRVEVAERAQIILYGAAATGMEMGTAEAMERAHLEVAAPMAEQVVRSRIAKSAQKREKGVTLQPNAKRTPERTGAAYEKSEAVDDVAAEMKKVFG